jgi:hypothetical protein
LVPAAEIILHQADSFRRAEGNCFVSLEVERIIENDNVAVGELLVSATPPRALKSLYWGDDSVGENYEGNSFIVYTFEKAFGSDHDREIGLSPCISRLLPAFTNDAAVVKKCGESHVCKIVVNFDASILLQAIDNDSFLGKELLFIHGVGNSAEKRTFVGSEDIVAVMGHVC